MKEHARRAAAASAAFLRTWWPWLLIGALVLVVLLVWWLVPKWQVHGLHILNPKTRGDLEDNFRKTITQLLTGIAVLVGAGFAYLQLRQQQRAAQQQQQAARDLLISNQVAKGFELLGNKEKIISQRLGGIYALEGVMNSSEQYYQPVLEALCAFVRDETRTNTDIAAPVTEIQTALTVIGRRNPGPGRVDLTGARIPQAALPRVNLRNANLGNADLTGADLEGADLKGANLYRANLSGTNLSKVNLTCAFLGGANLSGAHLDSANLTLATLRDADLKGTNLNHTNLDNANLMNANLTNAYLIEANLTLANLNGADLRGANLSKAEGLAQARLDGAYGDQNTKLDAPLTIKPRQPDQPAAGTSA